MKGTKPAEAVTGCVHKSAGPRPASTPLVEQAAQHATLPPEEHRECLEATIAKLLEFPGRHAVSPASNVSATVPTPLSQVKEMP